MGSRGNAFDGQIGGADFEGLNSDLSNSDEDVVVAVEPFLLSKPATCKALGDISIYSLERLMNAGEIVPRMLGGRVMFHIDEVRRFARELPSWEPRQSHSVRTVRDGLSARSRRRLRDL